MRTVAKLSIWLGAVSVLVGFDVATRVLCFQQCIDSGGWVGLAPFANFHFAFSVVLPALLMYSLYVAALLTLAWFGWVRWSVWSRIERIAFVLVLCGGLTNVLERLWLGYVRDFIRIFHGYYNLGDVYILVGIGLLLIAARGAEKK